MKQLDVDVSPPAFYKKPYFDKHVESKCSNKPNFKLLAILLSEI